MWYFIQLHSYTTLTMFLPEQWSKYQEYSKSNSASNFSVDHNQPSFANKLSDRRSNKLRNLYDEAESKLWKNNEGKQSSIQISTTNNGNSKTKDHLFQKLFWYPFRELDFTQKVKNAKKRILQS